MSKKDTLTKKYMAEPARFADFFNGYMYNGEEIIKPEDLIEVDTTNIALIPWSAEDANESNDSFNSYNRNGNNSGKNNNQSITVQKFRDILKQLVIKKSDKAYYLFLGIENQSDIHYAMPVRNMLYDSLVYNQQVETIAKYNRANGKCENSGEFLSGFTKNNKLIPVITVTVYWGKTSWDGPLTLKEMLIDETDEVTASMVGDYNCNLFSIIDMEELPEYKTELRELFNLLRMRKSGEDMQKLVENDIAYQNIDKETAIMMSEFADIKLPEESKEGGYDMCKAVMELRMEGQRIGEEIGKDNALVKAINNLMKNTKKSFEECCELLGICDEDIVRYNEIIKKQQ